MSYIYKIIGDTYRCLSNYKASIDNLQKSYEILKMQEENYSLQKQDILTCIGLLYNDQHQNSQAEKYYIEAKQVLDDENLLNTYEYGYSLYILARIRSQMIKKIPESFSMAQKALILIRSHFKNDDSKLKMEKKLAENLSKTLKNYTWNKMQALFPIVFPLLSKLCVCMCIIIRAQFLSFFYKANKQINKYT